MSDESDARGPIHLGVYKVTAEEQEELIRRLKALPPGGFLIVEQDQAKEVQIARDVCKEEFDASLDAVLRQHDMSFSERDRASLHAWIEEKRGEGAVKRAVGAIEHPSCSPTLQESILGWLSENGFGTLEQAKDLLKLQESLDARTAEAKAQADAAPDPTENDLKDPRFEAVWQAIKHWDIQRYPGAGYAGASGNDVMAILSQLRRRT